MLSLYIALLLSHAKAQTPLFPKELLINFFTFFNEVGKTGNIYLIRGLCQGWCSVGGLHWFLELGQKFEWERSTGTGPESFWVSKAPLSKHWEIQDCLHKVKPCSRLKNGLSKDIHAQTSVTCECCLIWQKQKHL